MYDIKHNIIYNIKYDSQYNQPNLTIPADNLFQTLSEHIFRSELNLT